ncbi:adhesion G protein-coupled receptor L3-like [Dermatophagoides pteronyssinus]|uniref:adhesion G protein-coupled receptor L3-like n=1 Tax=Dermatophagoides pteronyssinus TaxID=6956 RepID=UPI003F669C1D
MIRKIFPKTKMLKSIIFSLLFLMIICCRRSFLARTDECTDWYEICSQFQLGISPSKYCIGKTLYFFSNFMTDWESARSYCSGIFYGYQRGDLFYFDEKSDSDSDLRILLENYQPENQEFPTNALCCPTISDISHISKYSSTPTSLTYDIQCKWLHNGELIDEEYYQNIRFDPMDQCHFLMINLDSKTGAKFSRSVDVSYAGVSQFMCTYRRPPKCGNHITTTTTTESTKNTEKPITPEPTTSTPPTSTTTLGPIYCHELIDRYGFHWPSTNINQTARLPCPTNYKGTAEWLCDSNGQFVSNGPSIHCYAEWIDESEKNLEKIKNMKQLSKEVRHFQSNIVEKPSKFFKDFKQIINVIQKIEFIYESFVSNENIESSIHDVRNITESMVESCAIIIERESIWQQSQRHDRIMVAGKILNYIHDSGLTMGCYQIKNESDSDSGHQKIEPIKSEINPNIFMDAFNMDHEQPIQFDHLNYEFSLRKSIKSSNTDNVSDWCPHRLAIGALFQKLSRYMFDEHLQPETKMNSEIISFSYNNFSRKTFPLSDGNEARMKLIHHQQMEFGMKTKCVYWNFQTNLWSSNGCYVIEQESDRHHTTCACDHLTNFAVIMDISGQERPSKLKSILTIIMCTLSIICLVMTVIFLLICHELKSRRNSIIINISIMMIIIDLLVIFGLDRTEYPILCKSISISLLYTMLSLFFWMLMEGYNLYQMMIFIFNTKGHLRMLYLYLIGYGLPLLITIPATIYMQLKTELNNEYFCWITSTKYPGQIWFLAGPVTIIIIINTFIMIRVMKIVLSKNARNSFVHQSSFNNPSTSTKNGGRNKSLSTTTNGHFGKNISQNQQHTIGAKQRKQSDRINGKVDNPSSSSTDVISFEQRKTEWFTYLKGFFGLIILMGITWISYVLYIHQFGHYFSYVFIVMNGLQGVFIFITQFIFNRKAMDAVKKRLCNFGDFGSSFTSSTTTSYLSQKRISKQSTNNNINNNNNKINSQPTNGRKNNDNNDGDDDDDILSSDKYPYNVLIDRTTSFEY